MSSLAEVIAHPLHLGRRFATSLSPAPPSAVGEAWADLHLLPGERSLWVQLSNQDRRHSIDVAQRFVEIRPTATRAEISGALLHDIGKIECRLGTFARVVATLVGPRTERFRAYHDHEEIGARLARSVGSDPETVDLIAEQGPAYEDLSVADY